MSFPARAACALLAVLFSPHPAAEAAANGKKLIEWGVDQPDTAFMRQHAAEMDASPFDGTVFAASSNAGASLADAYWGAANYTHAEFTNALADLQATHFTKLTHNFLRLNVTPYGPSSGIDWFDNFDAILNNSRVAARLAKLGGAKGILIDTEQYTQPIFQYVSQRDAKTKSHAVYAAQVRLRASQIMQAFQEEYPDLTVFLALGASYPGIQAANEPANLPGVSYGLLAAFTDGLVDGAAGNSRIVDGFELGYPVSALRDGTHRIEWYLNYIHPTGDHPEWWDVLPILKSDPAKYDQHISAGFGTWMDSKVGGYAWDPNNPAANYFSPEDLENTLRTSLQFVDEYAWLYTQSPKWWTPEGGTRNLSDAYIDAVRRATGQVPEPSATLALLAVLLSPLPLRERVRGARAGTARPHSPTLPPLLLVCSLASFLPAPAYASLPLLTQNFNTNTDAAGSGWESQNNRTAPQNFGWSNTNNTGSTVAPPLGGVATGAGELGGTIARKSSPASFYGYNVGWVDVGDDFEARGVIRYSGGSGGFLLGYFRGASSYGSGGNAANFAGFFFDDARNSYAVVFDANSARTRSDSPYDLTLGRTVPFRLQYKTNGFNPDTLVLTLDGNVHTMLVGVTAPAMRPFTHFGLMPLSADGSSGTVWLDDLTFSVNPNPVPGDATGDGLVNQADMDALVHGLEYRLTGRANGDFNGDGRLTADDLAMLNLILSQQATGSTATPEPCGAIGSLLCAGGCGMRVRRERKDPRRRAAWALSLSS